MNLEYFADKKIKSRFILRTITSLGLMVELSTFGAGIQNIALIISDDPMTLLKLVLSYPDDEALIRSGSYAGRTLCPNSGRIGDSCLSINNEVFHLESNEGVNQLHGGPHNLSFTDWSIENTETGTDYVKVTFSASQPDGMDGFPGNRHYLVTYTIEDMGCITINYHATSDKPTYINMSNHSYWNLHGIEVLSKDDISAADHTVSCENPSGKDTPTDFALSCKCSESNSPENLSYNPGLCSAKTNRPEFQTTLVPVRGQTNNHIIKKEQPHQNLSGLKQLLMINANNVMLNQRNHLPLEMISVSGTPFDFRTPVSLSEMLPKDDICDPIFREQFLTAQGYNHAYLLAKPDLRRKFRGVKHYESLKNACSLTDPLSKRKLSLMTDAPAIVLYSGGFLSEPSLYIALEAQDIPNVCNILPESMTITEPDHPFNRTIRFHLG